MQELGEGEEATDIRFNKQVSKCTGSAMSWLLCAYEGVLTVNLEATLASIGYSRYFDDVQYHLECWRKWRQPEAVVPPAVADVEDGRAATLFEGDHRMRLEEDDVEGKSQFFEAYVDDAGAGDPESP